MRGHLGLPRTRGSDSTSSMDRSSSLMGKLKPNLKLSLLERPKMVKGLSESVANVDRPQRKRPPLLISPTHSPKRRLIVDQESYSKAYSSVMQKSPDVSRDPVSPEAVSPHHRSVYSERKASRSGLLRRETSFNQKQLTGNL